MSIRSEQLKQALIKAKEAAMLFSEVDDGGTCNFDAPTLRLERWKKTEIEEAITGAGLRYFEHRLFGIKYYVICGGTYGQGNRRTAMAEAMSKILKNEGYEASMYYQMD